MKHEGKTEANKRIIISRLRKEDRKREVIT